MTIQPTAASCPALGPLQSRIEEIGQALLKNTLLAAPNGLRTKRQGAAAGELLPAGHTRVRRHQGTTCLRVWLQCRASSGPHALCTRCGQRSQPSAVPAPYAGPALRPTRQPCSPRAEAYEEHFVLPDERVLLLTSAGILLLHAPGFAQLDGAAEIGGRDRVGPGGAEALRPAEHPKPCS